MNKNGIIIAIVGLVVLGGVAFFAMSGEDSSTDTSTNSSQTDDSPQVAQTSDIVELASATEQLSTLVTAVAAADLVETLQSSGPFTVLAPTNDAFSALPEGTLASLLETENKDQLAGILTYHVIAGEVMSTDLQDGQVVETVQGSELTVEISGGSVYFVDATGAKAMVATADVEASNGVVHIIDAVLLPQ